MTTNFNIVRSGSLALMAFVLLALPLSFVHAADDGTYDFYPTDTSSSYDFYPTDTSSSYDFYPTDTASYDFYPNTSYDSGSMGSSYLGSGSGGGSYLGGSYLAGPSYLPSRPVSSGSQTQSQSQAQVSNNTNTNVNNNVITVNTPAPAPAPVYTPPPVYNYPVCTLTVSNYQNGYGYNGSQPVTLSWTSQYATSGYISNGIGTVALSGSITVNPQYTTTYTGTFYGQNGQTVTCSAMVNRTVPIAYNNQTPYVALSAVPYTGLDLGFWGTIAYWGFLILWCLVAAYLVVVKKVQNRIFRSLSGFLFGNSAASQDSSSYTPELTQTELATLAKMLRSNPEPEVPVAAYSAPAPQVDAIDDFILSQINRARA